MPSMKPYVIEPASPSTSAGESAPPTHRPRIGAEIMGKLDEILAHVKGDEGGSAPDGAPEVTFEPELDQLPTATKLEEEDEEADDSGSGQGEGTTNTPEYRHPSPFKFPGARHVEVGR